MPNTTNSINMSLPVPVVGVDPGPDFATDVNTCLTLVDAHDHSAGYGVPVTPDGMNISVDLPFNSNNATLLRTTRWVAQVAPISLPTDLRCAYVVNNDLYFNDGLGNQIPITANGSIAGVSGSIAGLVAPASATYVAVDKTFVWQSNANTPANMDAASYIFRNLAANSFGLTLDPPASMGTDYTLTLPTLPGSTKIMTIDSAGTMGSVLDVDNSTLEIASNVLQVRAQGITQAQILVRAVPGATAGVGEVAVSGSSGAYTTTSSTFSNITNLSVTITTLGNPVRIFMISDGSGNGAFMNVGTSGGGNDGNLRYLLNGVSEISRYRNESPSGSVAGTFTSNYELLHIIGAGTHTYTAQINSNNNSDFVSVAFYKLVAYEIK